MEYGLYKQLLDAMKDAKKYEEGQKLDLRVAELPPPPYSLSPKEITQIREKLRLSQAVFAHRLNVSPATVRAWEQGRRTPNHAALKLLHIANDSPEALLPSST